MKVKVDARQGIPITRKKFVPGKALILEKPGINEDKRSKANLWRVIAPFLRVPKKGEEVQREDQQFSFYLQKKPEVLIRDLSSFLSDSVALPSLFHETADVLKKMTKASWVCLYMVDRVNNEIYLSSVDQLKPRHRVSWKINDESTLAAYVACKKEYVIVPDVLRDIRFPEGIGDYGTSMPKSVMCIPVVTPSDDCYAVIELIRLVNLPPFENNDLKISLMVTSWMGVAIHQNQERLALKRQQELNDYLLELIKCYFEDHVLMDKLMIEVIKFAKVTLSAERGSFFIMDNESDEMVAHLFDEDEGKEGTKTKRVRFSKESGIAGLVARTGQTVNIKDAYNDYRFNKDIDQRTGFITRSILCMPILGSTGVLGVVQVINKKNGGCFSSADENLFKTFSLYCSIAMHYTTVHNEINKKKYLNAINWKTIKLQQMPCIHDIRFYIDGKLEENQIPMEFDSFTWYVRNRDEMVWAPFYTLHMLTQLISPKEIHVKNMMKFILTARKTYRDIPYHNFEHAFNVCHCMFAILKRNKTKFTKLEVKALLIACICHDIDHVGFTNNFLQATNHDLAMLYEDSTLEQHHSNVTLELLQDYEIFRGLSKAATKQLYDDIRRAILSTDLCVYFENRRKLINLLIANQLDWKNRDHKEKIKTLIMNSCDLSGNCKPFLVAKRITDNLYKEFYNQGDLEKKRGVCVLSVMDRNQIDLIPDDQIRFQDIIVIPCMKLLRAILPTTNDLFLGATLLRSKWKDILDTKGKKTWRQDDSIVNK